jgi:hypothetical protein
MNEHGFDAKKVTQKEIAGFMKLCNDITLSKLGSSAVDFTSFVQLIL